MGDWKIEKGMCRCCHSEGSFQSLSELCVIGGEEGHYTDLLRLTLSISIRPVEGTNLVNTFTICDDCIMRLKDATTFKQQVLQCEARFYEMHSKGVIKVEPLIKQEPDTYVQKIEDEDSDFNNDPDAEVVESEPEEELNTGLLCKKEPDTVEMRKSGRTKKPSSLFDASTPQPKKPIKRTITKVQKQAKEAIKQAKKEAKAEAKQKKKKLEDVKKGSQPVFQLNEEDYRRDCQGGRYHCARCDKTFRDTFKLRDHVQVKHYKIPRFSCPHCDAKFMTVPPFVNHKLEVHNIDDRLKCNGCDKIFNTMIQLRVHNKSFHMLGKKYKCKSCEFETFSALYLYKHNFKHKTVKDFHCKFCKKSFLRKTNLVMHEKIHTGDKKKICSVCKKAFVQKASLNYHMSKYHPDVKF